MWILGKLNSHKEGNSINQAKQYDKENPNSCSRLRLHILLEKKNKKKEKNSIYTKAVRDDGSRDKVSSRNFIAGREVYLVEHYESGDSMVNYEHHGEPYVAEEIMDKANDIENVDWSGDESDTDYSDNEEKIVFKHHDYYG
ncbi:transducin/WD40 repeat-like superfamily protein [Striga asiatica]|uniref:Transducin/WD40 repeat-like superfamily protein n=1 Tax=Striga asiatica TaxID=4170 RepID=A0A5A7R5I7_STRAF|nr:transducin/WD40 repeat-like superfamily protein [Striga asiatica]